MQTARVLGISLVGLGAEVITVEARFQPGDRERTEVLLSGLPDAVIRESRSRLTCALEEVGLRLGGGRLWLHLAPAGLPKSGEALDLPLALGAAAACGHLDPRALRGALFLGEVGIDGSLHAVPGGLAAAEAARRQGVSRLIAPPRTASEAACFPGIEALSARRLGDVVGWAAGLTERLERAQPAAAGTAVARGRTAPLDGIRGQVQGKRALLVAAAGGHSLLLSGPPGAGKSLLARALPDLLPAPSFDERLEITRVLSAVGRWPSGLASARPFRAPHHTVSYAGLVGGGNPPRPGEITLAHRGVLFLDELPEFRRPVLEALRQPLESGVVDIARAGRQVELPCSFQLVAAMNPCPCGYHGDLRTPCRCSAVQVRNYRGRISGPLLDRIDLRLELAAPAFDELVGETARPPQAAGEAAGETTPETRNRAATEQQRAELAVEGARAALAQRGHAARHVDLDLATLDRWDPLEGELRLLLARAAKHRGYSARALVGLRRVARTLADLAGQQRVGPSHLAEAVALRAEL